MCETTRIGSRNIAVRQLLEIIFNSDTFVIDLNGLKSNLTSARSFSDMSSYVQSTSMFALSSIDGYLLGGLLEVFPTRRSQGPF